MIIVILTLKMEQLRYEMAAISYLGGSRVISMSSNGLLSVPRSRTQVVQVVFFSREAKDCILAKMWRTCMVVLVYFVRVIP